MAMHPFAFEKDGKFSTPHFDPLMSVHAANILFNHTPTSDKQRLAIDTLKQALPQMFVEKKWGRTKKNDVPANELKVYSDNLIMHSDRLCYVVVQPQTFQDIFQPDHELPQEITAHPNTWKWDVLMTLRPHKKVLENLCAELDITFNSTVFQRTSNMQKMLDKEVVVRQPDSFADLSRASGYAIFIDEDDSGFLDSKFNCSTIEKAMVFGSQRLAQMAIKRYLNQNTPTVIVEVEVSLKSVCTPTNNNRLHDALNVLQNERMSEVLKNMEIEQLQERLAQLQAPATKRKM